MLRAQFLLTSLIVVVLPGTGVLYTVSTGLTGGRRAGIAAAIGCTFGIVPHLLAGALGLSAVMHVGATVFTAVKYAGSAYLLYLAWQMWRETGGLALGLEPTDRSLIRVALRGIALNILNPKLTIFFLAFLPQFIVPGDLSPAGQLISLSLVFMFMTLAIFVLYALLAGAARRALSAMPRAIRWIQRSFALLFAGLAMELALSRR